MRDFTKYEVWIGAMNFAEKMYLLTRSFPDEEKFGLTAQMRRAAVSVPSNIAEGCSRSSDKDFARFIEVAVGSLFELRTQIILATKLGFCDGKEDMINEADTLSKQLNALRSKLLYNN